MISELAIGIDLFVLVFISVYMFFVIIETKDFYERERNMTMTLARLGIAVSTIIILTILMISIWK